MTKARRRRRNYREEDLRAHVITFTAAMLMASSAHSAELIVLSGQGATPGVREVAAAFARMSGHTVMVLQPAPAELVQRLDHGPADILVSSPEPIDDLLKKGKLLPDTVKPWVLAGLGVSVRAGAPKPDIGTVEAYKAALIAAKSIGYSFGCSGTNVAEGIETLGLTAQLKPKTTRTGSQGGGGPVTDYLARGDFELGIQQSNIMVGVPGTDYVGPVPGSLNKPCPSSVAMATVSKEPEAARAMIAFMISPAAAPLVRKTYVEPAAR
jgi:molybdate transport system substrate-binding protein